MLRRILILCVVFLISFSANGFGQDQTARKPTISVKATNGIKLRVASMGTGPLVILMHGFPETWYSWRHQLPALADAGYMAVAPDMRGFGGSSKPDQISDYQISKITADIVGLVDAFGKDQAILIGHDWGALVGWAAMLQHPDRFRAFAAISVPYAGRQQENYVTTLQNAYGENFQYILYFQKDGVAEAELDKDPKGFLTRVYTSQDVPKDPPTLKDPKMSAGGYIPRLPLPKRLPDWLSQKDFDHFVNEFTQSGFRGGLNYYRNFDHFFEVSQKLKEEKVAQPVLFIAGQFDPIIGGANEDQLKAMLGNGTKDLKGVHVIPNVGHWVNQEAIEPTNKAILNFIKSLD